MIEVARHFMPLATLKRQIDAIKLVKLSSDTSPSECRLAQAA
jgi:hypothetical protein